MAVLHAKDGVGLDVCCNKCMSKIFSISNEEYMQNTRIYDYIKCDDCKSPRKISSEELF